MIKVAEAEAQELQETTILVQMQVTVAMGLPHLLQALQLHVQVVAEALTVLELFLGVLAAVEREIPILETLALQIRAEAQVAPKEHQEQIMELVELAL
jgi:hypothetical protein